MELLRTLECFNSFLSMILYARFKNLMNYRCNTYIRYCFTKNLYTATQKESSIMAKEKGYKSLGINPLCAEWYIMYIHCSYVAKGDLAFPGHMPLKPLWISLVTLEKSFTVFPILSIWNIYIIGILYIIESFLVSRWMLIYSFISVYCYFCFYFSDGPFYQLLTLFRHRTLLLGCPSFHLCF